MNNTQNNQTDQLTAVAPLLDALVQGRVTIHSPKPVFELSESVWVNHNPTPPARVPGPTVAALTRTALLRAADTIEALMHYEFSLMQSAEDAGDAMRHHAHATRYGDLEEQARACREADGN